MELSIIIVNWNCKQYLDKCLRSIFDNKIKYIYEVIVIDNNSKDKINGISKRYNVRLIKLKKNYGFAKACNQGIKQSNGKYILFLNPDTVVLKSSINKMVDYLEENKKIGAAGPKLLNEDKSLQTSTHGFASLMHVFFEISYLDRLFPKNSFFRFFFGKIFGKISKNLYANYIEYKDIAKVDFVSAACMLTRKDVIKKVGMFDENFFIYHEEMEWFYRFKKKGFKCIYYPFSEVIHYGGKCVDQAKDMVFVERCKSLKYFYRKHFKNKLLFFNLVAFIALIVNSLISIIIYKNKKEIIRSRVKALKSILL